MGSSIHHDVAFVFDRDASDVFNITQSNNLPLRYNVDMRVLTGLFPDFDGRGEARNTKLSHNNRVVTFDSDCLGVFDLAVLWPALAHNFGLIGVVSRYDGLQGQRFDYVEALTVDQLPGHDFYPYENHPLQVEFNGVSDEEFEGTEEEFDAAMDKAAEELERELTERFNRGVDFLLEMSLVAA